MRVTSVVVRTGTGYAAWARTSTASVGVGWIETLTPGASTYRVGYCANLEEKGRFLRRSSSAECGSIACRHGGS